MEDKAGNEQQLWKKLSMEAQDNDAKHDNVNSQQEAYQEDDNLKLRNGNIQKYRSSSRNWIRMAEDTYRKTQRYIANLQSIFDFPEEN